MNDQEKQTGPVEDHRSKPRWSANRKMDAVLRLLRGEPLDQLSRELEVEAHTGLPRGGMTSSSTADRA